MNQQITINVTWRRPPWWRMWNRYEHGAIEGDPHNIASIYRNAKTLQMRLYSGVNFEGVELTVNGLTQVMRQRGRFGMLYLGYPK